MNALNQSKDYKRFVHERDVALEQILQLYQRRISGNLAFIKKEIEAFAADLHQSNLISPLFIENLKPEIDRRLTYHFKLATNHAFDLMRRMRVTIYILAHAGEAEAISRSLNTPQKSDISFYDLRDVTKSDAPAGGPLKERLGLYYTRLKNRVMEAFIQGMLVEDDLADLKKKIDRAFPEVITVKRPKRLLKRVKEAEKIVSDNKRASLSVGVVDDDAWQQAVRDYNDAREIVPRGTKGTVEFEEEEQYYWEVQKEITEDFVQKVRTGQVDAANKNGITDMMWIAIIDDRTDECCKKRDGLTSSEIEEKLSDEWKDDECDAIAPPAHYNCRCSLAPVTDKLPETKEFDYGDFEEWLNAR